MASKLDVPRLERLQEGYNAPLSSRMKKVAEGVGQGMSWRAAAQHAGLTAGGTSISKWSVDPRMTEIIVAEQARFAKAAELKREDVIEGLKDAVALSKLMSDPHALIKAWSELGRLCGFYAPEIKKLDISLTSKRVISQLEQLSERELLELANEELGATFEGHFRRLPGPVELSVRKTGQISDVTDIQEADLAPENDQIPAND